MPDAITRCPKCGTSFRITEAHLNSAKGAVRCGSCLNIFHAKENLISEKSHEESINKTTRNTKPLTNKPKPQKAEPEYDDSDEMLISDDMVQDQENEESEDIYGVAENSEGVQNSRPAKSLKSEESNLFERDITDEEGDDEDESSDESWALNLLKNLDDEDEDRKLFKPKDETSPAPTEVEPPKKKSKRIPPKKKEAEKPNDLKAIFESRSPEPQQDQELNPFQIIEEQEPEPELEPEPDPEPTFNAQELFGDIDQEINEDSYPRQDHLYDTGRQNDYLDSIEPEPVEFAFKKHGAFWTSAWVWRTGIIAASLLLFAEIAWLQFPNLSRVEPYRSYYASACKALGCQLPTLIDRSKIRAANLVVRSHPSIADALIVDAVLQNAAGFPQRFPDLDLTFTDVKDKPVAARRFTPQEYLGGELAGSKNMPMNQPVYIALEIKDPGAAAVSYRIAIAN